MDANVNREKAEEKRLRELGNFLADSKNWSCVCGAVPDETAAWRWNGSIWEHHHGGQSGHFPAIRKGDLQSAFKALIVGVERWASDEDGVHPECWNAYKEAKAQIGQFDWKETS